MSQVVKLLQELVSIPSVNPDGDPGCPAEQTGEEELADFIAGTLSAQGFQIILEEIRPGRPNLIARAPGSDDRPRIFFGPHSDTVGVGGMTIDPFGAEIQDDRLWGRGASDTKGPMAAMLWGLLENSDLLAELPVAVDFVAFMGEESSQHGSRHFAQHHAESYEFALVGEPTSLDFVHVTKGSVWATLTATGRAAHSSQPERGENAILKLGRALDFLNRKYSARLATFNHPILGHATFNVGTFSGGTRANIVPDHAQAQIDIRTVPELTTGGGALQHLEDFIAENQLPVEIVSPHENPPMEVPIDHLWMQRLSRLCPESNPVGAPWFSDAAHLCAVGLPAICVGPGSIDQAHTADEFIALEDLENGARFFSSLVRGLADTGH